MNACVACALSGQCRDHLVASIRWCFRCVFVGPLVAWLHTSPPCGLRCPSQLLHILSELSALMAACNTSSACLMPRAVDDVRAALRSAFVVSTLVSIGPGCIFPAESRHVAASAAHRLHQLFKRKFAVPHLEHGQSDRASLLLVVEHLQPLLPLSGVWPTATKAEAAAASRPQHQEVKTTCARGVKAACGCRCALMFVRIGQGCSA